MARRTKEEAAETRASLLDAAERVIYSKGFSRTTLADIAQDAGTTRGAIYWHFKDKIDLFCAMMDRVVLPLEDTRDEALNDPDIEPLERLCKSVDIVMQELVNNERARRVIELCMFRVEYTDEMQILKRRHIKASGEWHAQFESDLRAAVLHANLSLTIDVQGAALGLCSLVDGLLHRWIFNGGDFDLVVRSKELLALYLRGLGFKT